MEVRGWRRAMCDLSTLLLGIQDAAYMAQNMVQAAESVGLGSCYMGGAPYYADRIVEEARRFGAEAVLVSRIPGASHCAREGGIIVDRVASELGIPTVEIEVPPLSDSLMPTIRTRLQALVEAVRARRRA